MWSVAVLASLVAGRSASALDFDYYTYGGFTPTVQAFRRMALVFNDGSYAQVLGLMLGFGLLVGIVKGILEANRGGGWAVVRPFAWAIVATGVIVSSVYQTGTVFVFDPVQNKAEAVGNVPDLIVAIAGGLNLVERNVIDIIDLAQADVDSYGLNAGGVGFNLLYNAAVDDTGRMSDGYLYKSVKRYFKDCSQIPLESPLYPNVSVNMINSDTTNLAQVLADMVSTAVYTVYYTEGNKAGATMTCSDAWNIIGPRLDANATWQAGIEEVCERTGYDTTHVLALANCTDMLEEMQELVYGVVAPARHLMRNLEIADAITEVSGDANPDLGIRMMANRQMMVDGLGAAVTSAEWIPQIRAVVNAITLGLLPFLILLCPTPLFGKALKLTFGVLLWTTVWGITDALIHSMLMDMGAAFARDIESHGMGVKAMMLTPTAVQQATSLFGVARSMGAMLSAMIVSALVAIPAYNLGAISERWTERANNLGGSAAGQAMLPEAQGQLLRAMAAGLGTREAANAFGMNAMATSESVNQGMQTVRGGAISAGLGGATNAAMRSGTQSGASDVGRVSGTEDAATGLTGIATTGTAGQVSEDASRIGAMANVAGMKERGRQGWVNSPGNEPGDRYKGQQTLAEHEQADRLGTVLATGGDAGQVSEAAKTDAEKRFGAAEGIRSVAGAENVRDASRTMSTKQVAAGLSEGEAFQSLAATHPEGVEGLRRDMYGTNQGIQITPDNADWARDTLGLTDAQARQVEDTGGGTLSLSYNQDEGRVVGSSFQAGFSTSMDNSDTSTNRTSLDESTVITTGQDGGNPLSIGNVLTSPNSEGAERIEDQMLSSTLDEYRDGNEQAFDMMAQGLARYASMSRSAHVYDSDKTGMAGSIDGQAGWSSGGQAAGWLAKLGTGFEAKAGVNVGVNASRENAESVQTDAQFAAAQAVFKDSANEAVAAADQLVSNGIPFPSLEGRADYERERFEMNVEARAVNFVKTEQGRAADVASRHDEYNDSTAGQLLGQVKTMAEDLQENAGHLLPDPVTPGEGE